MQSPKSSFLRLFSTGFVAGALALVALQPAATTQAFGEHFHLLAKR